MRKLARDRRGVAAVEFALVLPVLCLLLVGFLDVVHVGRGHLRVQSAATQVGQIMSQCKSVASTDEAAITKLAENTLKPYSNTGKKWAVVVTAIRVNASNQPVDATGKPGPRWKMDNRATAGGGHPGFTTLGTTLPADLVLKTDQVMFRTEVFAELDATLFTRANSLIAGRMGSRPKTNVASSSVLHISRSSDADKLNKKTEAEACLS